MYVPLLNFLWLVTSAALIAGCSTSRPAPVSERTLPAPRTASAKPVPGPKPASGPIESAPAARGAVGTPDLPPATSGVVAAPLKTTGDPVQAKPLGSAGAPATAATPAPAAKPGAPPAASTPAAPSTAATIVTEPKGVRLPYSDQALAQLTNADIAQPKPEPRVEAKFPPPPPRSDTTAEAARGPDSSDWIWPVKGKVLSSFNGTTSKGIDIGGKRGQPVLASAPGRVIFSGTGVRGMGKFIVIKHSEELISVYGHNEEIFVKYGQSVRKGQKIAEMGSTDADQVKLHFEIRRNGTPIDPLTLLPSPA